MQNRWRRAKLELRGSRSGLGIAPRRSRCARPAQSFALIPILATKKGCSGGSERRGVRGGVPRR
eukprot:11679595-Alexandrium_andersonii.AAC.1